MRHSGPHRQVRLRGTLAEEKMQRNGCEGDSKA